LELIEEARSFAEKAHKGQKRRLSDDPYFVHPESVAKILQEASLSDELIAAGYLHDTVEDTNVNLHDIRERFGDKVAEIVAGNTEDKTKTWEERKEHTIQSVKTASFEVKCLIAADKLDNLRSISLSSLKNGDIWSHFNRGKKEQAWYYESIAKALFENVKKEEVPPFFSTYESLVKEVFSPFVNNKEK
jgi:guanosine-3',5'-bis(diphosphate) 3'-pyrophosphohydrolase